MPTKQTLGGILLPKYRTIALTAQHEGKRKVIRMERLVPSQDLNTKEIEHRSTSGPFENVLVLKKTSLESVCKPHVETSFNAYVTDTNERGQFLEKPQKKEHREVKFWFYRGVTDDLKMSTCTQFLKLLLHPETFPVDKLGYIKKCLLLTKHFEVLRRVELHIVEEEIQVEEPEEIPLIENFITVLTPAMYDYQYLPEVPVSKKSGVSFRLKAAGDGHVALSYVYGDTDRRTYEVVIGGWGNRRSAIKYGGRGEIQVEKVTPGILSGKEFRDFWISWKDGSLKFGRGLKEEEGGEDEEEGGNCIMEWKDIPAKKRHSINLISVSTGPASDGRWEFVEYIVAYEMSKESKGEKRQKVLKGLVWYSKKMKIMNRLEDSFPACLNTQDLLRLSTVSLSNMLEALVFLKRSQKDGNVLETRKGIWMRSHAHPSDQYHELKKVVQIPRFPREEAPKIAIITSTYMEKVAVDVMFEKKISYLIEGHQKQDKLNNQFYTVGSMAGKNVVSMKLSHFNPELASSEKHAQCVNDLLDRFESVEFVLVAGVGGAVPDYNNFENHRRRGDVIISSPRPTDGAFYVCCSGVDDEQDVDPTGNSAFFPNSSWNSDDGCLQRNIRKLVDQSPPPPPPSLSSSSSTQNRPWERYLEEALDHLGRADERFHRPPEKSDKLLLQLNRRQEPFEVNHPKAPTGTKKHLRRENQPLIRRGAIASGKCVSRDHIYRRVFAARNQIQAFDCGLEKVVELLMNRVGGEKAALVLGMSDYVDGTIGKSWQPYAALASAAAVKALISML